jgi:hypothetical protein
MIIDYFTYGLGMALGEFFTQLHKAVQSEEPRSHLLNGGLGSFMARIWIPWHRGQ